MSDQEITLYADPNIQSINEEIDNMQEQIIDLTEDKIEIENKIHDFNNQYNETVGPHLIEYLKQREKNILHAIEDTDNKEKKEELKTKLETAQEDINDFKTHQKNKPDTLSLTAEQEIELKTLYKKACRLCHPDMVDDSFKEEALSLFHSLNEANQKKDISKVREILQHLQESNYTISPDISDIQILKKRQATLKSEIIKIQLEIQELKQDNTYKKIQDIQDWDRYFKIISKQLEKEIYKQEI